MNFWTISFVISGLLFTSLTTVRAESTCYGTPSHGRLEEGEQIPESGSNFTPYSSLGVMLGRTYAHAKVVNAIATAYQMLQTSAP
ncbi:hypothetical protein [Thiofilum flexile]|uniref:hypothetical protein n=1 Tax=Thiofilum flexile TaxID=125627 RepID=UPI001B7FCACE|nr:hypothetical protein [Thiofilum flexile]